MIRKTKIIATIGPSTSSKEVLKKLILKGTTVCRLNFSHISHEKAKETISLVNKVSILESIIDFYLHENNFSNQTVQ